MVYLQYWNSKRLDNQSESSHPIMRTLSNSAEKSNWESGLISLIFMNKLNLKNIKFDWCGNFKYNSAHQPVFPGHNQIECTQPMKNLLLQFNINAYSMVYHTDLHPKNYEEFLLHGNKINFLVFDGEEQAEHDLDTWHLAIEPFTRSRNGILSISSHFFNEGLFSKESSQAKNELHAMFTALAGSLYYELGHELQPVVTYAVDAHPHFFTASKHIPNFEPGELLREKKCRLINNELFDPTVNISYQINGLVKANLLNNFLDNKDSNEGNWGAVFDKENKVVNVVQIDTETCFEDDFFNLKPENVAYILKNPLQGCHTIELDEQSYSELYEQLEESFFPEEESVKAKEQALSLLEQSCMDEAIFTLFKIISTPNQTYKNIVDHNLNRPSALPYKKLFYNALIENKAIFAEEALQLKPYLNKAQSLVMEDNQWLCDMTLQWQQLYNQLYFHIGPHRVTGYCPLRLFTKTTEIELVAGVEIDEQYDSIVIKAYEFKQLVHALKLNYEEPILTKLLPKLEVKFNELMKHSVKDKNPLCIDELFSQSGQSNADDNSLPSILDEGSKVQENAEQRTSEYTPVHLDLITASTSQFASSVVFEKRSVDTSLVEHSFFASPHNKKELARTREAYERNSSRIDFENQKKKQRQQSPNCLGKPSLS